MASRKGILSAFSLAVIPISAIFTLLQQPLGGDSNSRRPAGKLGVEHSNSLSEQEDTAASSAMVPKLVPSEHENKVKSPDAAPININSDDIQALAEQLSKLNPKERAELARLLQASSRGNLSTNNIHAENV